MSPLKAFQGWLKSVHFAKELSVFDAILTFASVLGLIVLGYQSCELRRTNEMALTAQRAWVGPISIDLTPWEPGKPLELSVKIENSGATPAFKITSLGRWARRPPDWVFEADYKDSVERRWGVMQPGGSGSIPISVPATNADVEQLKNGTITLYFWGRIDYEDVSHSQPRWTTFCYVLQRDSSVSPCNNTYTDAR